MIFLFFAICFAIWLYFYPRKKDKFDIVFTCGAFLVIFFFLLEAHFWLLGSDIDHFYSAGGSSGSGLVVNLCSGFDENGTCNQTKQTTYLSGTDTLVGTYIGYRESEHLMFGVLAPAMMGALLVVLGYQFAKPTLEQWGIL